MKVYVTAALQALQPPRPGTDRSQIGASEVGGCPRLLVHRRSNPENTDSWIGKAMRGHALEPECIAIVSTILEGDGWTVNHDAAEFTDGPITTHPDFNATKANALVVNDIKTSNQGVFRKVRKGEIASYYLDQVQAQIGTARAEGENCTKGVLWFFQADDLGECEAITVEWDEDRYNYLKAKALDAQTALLFGMLPKGEVCYQCDKCPIRSDCPAWAHDQPQHEGDFLVELRVQTLLERLRELDPPATDEDKAIKTEIEAIKEDLKNILPKEGMDLKLAKIVWQERAGAFDTAKWNKDFPDLADKYRKATSRFPSITWKG